MKRIGFILSLIGGISFLLADGGWRSEIIASNLGNVWGIVIAEGRNDDTNRIYLKNSDEIIELTYSNGRWHKSIVDRPINGIRGGMNLGIGRNDGVMRLYALVDTTDPQIWEYTYNGTKWEGVKISNYPHYLSGLLVGPGRNDDTVRLYCGSQSFDPFGILEFTYTGNGWEIHKIGDTTLALRPRMICAGHNDDTMRLYAAGGWELTYSNGVWRQETTSVCTWIGYKAGDGRNDGLVRFYSGGNNMIDEICELYEVSWSQGKWVRDPVDIFPRENYHWVDFIAIGPGRGDDTSRVYWNDRDTIWEYTFRDGEWEKEGIPKPKIGEYRYANSPPPIYEPYAQLVIGKGRNDDTSRIYLGLLEFTYTGTGVDEKNSVAQYPFSLSVYPTPSHQGINIIYSLDSPQNIRLEIYDATGRLIRILEEGRKVRGKYAFHWDAIDRYGRKVCSGVYFCMLRAGDKVRVGKITLLK